MRSWNLGTIYSSGVVSTDILGQQAKNAGLLDVHKTFLASLAALIPGAAVKKTPKETAWYVVSKGTSINIETLLADEARKQGWLKAMAAFQAACTWIWIRPTSLRPLSASSP